MAVGSAFGLMATGAGAVTTQPSLKDYLVVVTGDELNVGDPFDVDNNEFGAFDTVGLAPGSLPQTSAKLDTVDAFNAGLLNYKLDSGGNVDLDSNDDPVVNDTPFLGYDGDIAVTKDSASLNFKITVQNSKFFTQDRSGHAGARGIDCAVNVRLCTDNRSQLSNSEVGDPSLQDADPSSAESTDFVQDSVGVFGNVDLSNVLADIALLNSALDDSGPDTFLGLSVANKIQVDEDLLQDDGTRPDDNFVLNVTSGLNYVSWSTEGDDFLTINNINFIVEGPVDAFVVIDLEDARGLKASESNFLLGGGLASNNGINNVLFAANTKAGNNSFDFNNVNFAGYTWFDAENSVAFDNIADWDNVRGCGQLVVEGANLSNVSMTQCAFNINMDPNIRTNVPLPASAWLLLAGVAGLGVWRRRQQAA